MGVIDTVKMRITEMVFPFFNVKFSTLEQKNTVFVSTRTEESGIAQRSFFQLVFSRKTP